MRIHRHQPTPSELQNIADGYVRKHHKPRCAACIRIAVYVTIAVVLIIVKDDRVVHVVLGVAILHRRLIPWGQ